MRVVFDGTSLVLSYTAGNTSSQTFRPERYPTARYVTAEVPETLDADPRTDLATPPAEECSAEAPGPEEPAARPEEESDARVPAEEETATLPVEEPAAEVPETLDDDPRTGLAAPPATECSAEDPEPEEPAAKAPEPEEPAARPAEETFQTR